MSDVKMATIRSLMRSYLKLFFVLVLSTNYVKCKNIPFHISAYYFTQQSSFQELFLFIPFFLEFQNEKFNFSYFNNVVTSQSYLTLSVFLLVKINFVVKSDLSSLSITRIF